MLWGRVILYNPYFKKRTSIFKYKEQIVMIVEVCNKNYALHLYTLFLNKYFFPIVK